jgi:hypothetical protein
VATVGNVNEILDGHVVLDLECLDRIYLNADVPTLQVGGQVVTFYNQHRKRRPGGCRVNLQHRQESTQDGEAIPAKAITERLRQGPNGRKRQAVLVLDEFQEIVTLDPELPARMRATFQF